MDENLGNIRLQETVFGVKEASVKDRSSPAFQISNGTIKAGPPGHSAFIAANLPIKR